MEKISFKYNNRYLYILVMLSMTFPLFNHLPIFQRHYIFILLGFVLLFLSAREFFVQNFSVALILHVIISYLNFLEGDSIYSSLSSVINEAIRLALSMGIFYSLVKYSDRSLFHFLFIIFIFFLIESTIVAVIANHLFPGIMRYTASAESAEEASFVLAPFEKYGMSDYSMPHAIPALVPGLVYGYRKTKGYLKWTFLVAIATAIVLVYVSNSSTALILAVLVFLFTILIKPNSSSRNVLSILLVFAVLSVFLTNKNVQLNSLHLIENYVPEETNIHRKVLDIESSIEHESVEGTVENRTIQYDITFNEFISHPFLGTTNMVGGHSSILDRFATLGLIGMIPFIFMIVLFAKFVIRKLPKEKRFYFILGLFAALIMMLAKNSMTWSMWLLVFLFLPGILLFYGDDLRG